ncbi:amidohydrolase family protein [Saccharicrinis sp. FJH62]|uniref:amidohydrolase family protein n=1 Tax=Saccharicrinis sp. FJH62 TaxID=3344657 RepID=UPI0035D3EB22
MMIIDTHHHLWQYNPVEFDWIDDEMAIIRKSFLPDDLQQTIKGTGIEQVITVQARQTLEETDWLLTLAEKHDFMKGVIGWVPLASPDLDSVLEKYKGNLWLKGVRHVVQGETDPEFILGQDFNNGITLLKEYDLLYEILIFEHQLPNSIRFVDKHPDQVFVLDHIAKPKIKTNEIKDWKNNMYELAKRDNVYCKLSGIVTEANYKTWNREQLQPYFDVVLKAFGPERLMFGSDWPVCLVATEYEQWVNIVRGIISGFSQTEQDQILFKNAQRVYNI